MSFGAYFIRWLCQRRAMGKRNILHNNNINVKNINEGLDDLWTRAVSAKSRTNKKILTNS